MTDTVRSLAALQAVFADGQAPGSITPQDMRDLIVSVRANAPVFYAGSPDYGVVANGSTDDTTAWGAVLTAAGAKGGIVIPPPGVSVVNASGIAVPSGVTIIGSNHRPGSGAATLGTVIKSSVTTGTSPVVTMAGQSSLVGISIVGPGTDNYGNGTSRECIYITSNGRCSIENCMVTNGYNGLNLNYTSENFVRGCVIQQNGSGCAFPVDSHFVGNAFSSNGTNVYLGPGSNHCMWVGNRFEWSSGHGINFDGFSGSSVGEHTFSGNTFDRCGLSAIRMSFARHIVLTGNLFQRNSPNATAASSNDSHIQMDHSATIVITGNSSLAGTGDSGEGAFSPSYAVYDGGSNTNCLIKSNVWVYHSVNGTSGGGINSTTTFSSFNTDNVVAAATASYTP